MKVAPTSPHSAEHEGRRYVFCSAGCRAKFIAAPERYVDAKGNRLTGSHTHAGAHGRAAIHPGAAERAPSRALKEVPAGTIYTCPMHPEIRQVGPGSCPICGMALEPLLPAAEEDDSEVRAVRRRFWIS